MNSNTPARAHRTGTELLAEMRALRVAEPVDPAFAEPLLQPKQSRLELWLERRMDRWIDSTRPARQAKIQASRCKREQEAAEAEQRAAKEAAEAVEAAQRAAKAEAEAAELFAQQVQRVERDCDPEEKLAELHNCLMVDRRELCRRHLSPENHERARQLINACLNAINTSVGSPAERVIRTVDLINATLHKIEAMEADQFSPPPPAPAPPLPTEPVSDDLGLFFTCLALAGLAGL